MQYKGLMEITPVVGYCDCSVVEQLEIMRFFSNQLIGGDAEVEAWVGVVIHTVRMYMQ